MKAIKLEKVTNEQIRDLAKSVGLQCTGSGAGMGVRDWSIQNLVGVSGQRGQYKALPIHPEQIESIRKYCRAHGIDLEYVDQHDAYCLSLTVPLTRWL